MRANIILFFFIGYWQFAFGQEYIATTQTYTTEDGLSSNEVYAIHKDSRGFMWVGTQYGLNRLDGEEIKVYTPIAHPEMNIGIIHEIYEDSSGYLWLLKKNDNYLYEFQYPEISLLNIHTGEFTDTEKRFGSHMPFKVRDIDFMNQLEDGRLFFYCQELKKGYTYTAHSGFQLFPIPEQIQSIGDIILQEDGNYLIKHREEGVAKNWELYKINANGELIARQAPNLRITIQDNDQSRIVQLKGSSYSTGGFNLDAYHLFDPNLSSNELKASNTLESIDQSSWNKAQQLMWLKSRDKLLVINQEGELVFERKEKVDDRKIPIFFDENTTWLSNKREGLLVIDLQPNHFNNYRFFEKEFDNSTRGIYKDQNGLLWISTINGLVHFDEERQAVSWQKETGVTTRFLKDNRDNLWYVDGEYLVARHLPSNKPIIDHYIAGLGCDPWDFYQLNEDEVWYSGHNGVIYSIDLNNQKITQKSLLPTDLSIGFHIYEYIKRDEKTIWLCTNQGLYIVDQQGQLVAIYNKKQRDNYYLPANAVHHLYQDKEGILWLATGDAGLLQIRLDQKNMVLENQFTITEGLSSNALHAVYEDEYGYLWISSDNGLMQFDKQSHKATKYFTENGIPHNEFNRIGHLQEKDGRLYFGGLLGITTFHPKNFAGAREKGNSNSPLAISHLHQFSGKKEQFEDRTADLLQTNSITLQASDQFFELKVALLDYQPNVFASYSYRIPGLYDWRTSKNGNLSISGLPYGKHQLEIKALNGNQQTAANELQIDIKVLRPFYWQWWFLLAAISAFGIGLVWAVKRRTRTLLVRQEAKQLKALDKMKSLFFTNISHELRTPLTLIDLPLQHLINQFDELPKEEAMQHIHSISRNKTAIQNLINEILDLSKLESGELELEENTVYLKYFLEKTIGAFQSAAEIKKLRFHFSCQLNEQTIVLMDAAKLEMVINNLLSNALKFTPEEGTIEISTSWNQAHELSFTIKDSGRGIHADDLLHVFNRYFQTNNKHTALEGGSGIGLAICKEYIEWMGGQIQVQSEYNSGSIFSFRLPLALQKEKTKQQPIPHFVKLTSPAFAKEQIHYHKNKARILIVEDHPELRYYLKEIINKEYNVTLAHNGKEALKQLSSTDCQLIISDLMMPEMDGFTLLEKVRKDERLCVIPFIMLTARTAVKDKLQGLRIGVDTYMTKPFDAQEVLLNIRNLLKNVQNRMLPGEAIEKTTDSTAAKKTVPTPPLQILPEEFKWLEQVEQITSREIKSPKYGVEQLAKELLMSRSQLYRKIKKMTGLTPLKYINAIRLRKAKSILETENPLTLTEVCYAIGFENTTHFAKQYEAEFGKRPHLLLKKTTV